MISSAPLRLAVKAALNCALIWAMNTYLPAYITVFGDLAAYVIIGCLLTLLNLFLRPILALVTFPLHLVFTLLTSILVNAVFLGIVYQIALKMDPNIVILTITGGATGWIVVSTVLGLANWVMKFL